MTGVWRDNANCSFARARAVRYRSSEQSRSVQAWKYAGRRNAPAFFFLRRCDGGDDDVREDSTRDCTRLSWRAIFTGATHDGKCCKESRDNSENEVKFSRGTAYTDPGYAGTCVIDRQV